MREKWFKKSRIRVRKIVCSRVCSWDLRRGPIGLADILEQLFLTLGRFCSPFLTRNLAKAWRWGRDVWPRVWWWLRNFDPGERNATVLSLFHTIGSGMVAKRNIPANMERRKEWWSAL